MIIRAKAPLRLGLAGGGTDIESYSSVYGGQIINATIGMYAFCTIEPTDSGAVEFIAADMEIAERYDSVPELSAANALKLHAGVYNRIVADCRSGKPLSFRMTTYADAPVGSGLGTSSTLVVAMIKAFTEWLNLPLGEYDIAALAYRIERVDLGFAGGKQDQYAATFGGFNFMEFYQDNRVIVNPLRLKRWIRNELENSLVLYYTGVSRESAAIINQQIDNTENHNRKSLDNMHELKKHAQNIKAALLTGDFPLFSRCLSESWEAKKNIADAISNPFINGLYEYALANGGESGKISGAGGGGFLMCYCNPGNRMRLIRALKKRDGVVITPTFTETGTQAWTVN
jgi:D-glycero-alpha-D-manno-heptose-7-phosphate kinase